MMDDNRARFDYLIKLIIIGDVEVGKTSLLLKYTENNHKQTYMTTIGIDFKYNDSQILCVSKPFPSGHNTNLYLFKQFR